MTRLYKHVCAVEGCERPSKGKHCNAHATRLRVHGDVGPAEIRRMLPSGIPPEERIVLIGWTVTDAGCWEWKGRVDEYGYGRVDDLRQVPVRVHRVAHEKWIGPIPEGMLVMHSCDNPPCLNPAHLSYGTVADNLGEMSDKGRAWQSKKTHCIHGHEFSRDNTKVITNPQNGRPRRKCIQCMQDAAARHARKKAA